jgi:hypothetical protein
MREAAAADSTTLRNNGTTGGGVSTVAGLVGSAQSLTNSGWIGVSAVANDVPGSTFAISGFIWTTFAGSLAGSTPFSVVTSTRANVLWNKIGGTNASVGPVVSAGEAALVTGTTPAIAISTGVRVDTGAWRHIAYVRNGGTGTLYIDGASRGTHTATQTYATTDQWHFGRGRYQGLAWSGFFLGRLDEMRIAPVARSGDWITAEDATARSNSGFTTYAAVEVPPATASAFFGW